MTTVAATATLRAVVVPRRTAPVPFRRLVGVELRKMFDTRSSFWLLASIGIVALAAVPMVIAFQPTGDITYAMFVNTIGYPWSLMIPMVGLLSVTGEWSQRGGLTTFAFVPRRGRVIGAKAACAAGVVLAAMALCFALSAAGNVAAAAVAGIDPVWDVSAAEHLFLTLFQAIGMAAAFTLAVVLRSSPAALVGYFVFALVVPTLSSMLAGAQEWYGDVAPWVDLTHGQLSLFAGTMTGEQWAQLGTTAVLWLVVPLVLGMRRLLRVEIR
ncbi:ABC transporter permease [Isoptericola sp. NEAU-Y5]|uniref:ABC transporter permease n=1 Tax=Isoptericola luteus TaxID=2879484 RepID=A0ABS7ZF61_9MICO|nr:ABC transporter permease [Isoptericola sp. NEAU-Y5]MCA5893681.1 ABC transporter permease [Isoptericola sp. NEAU-Y5]